MNIALIAHDSKKELLVQFCIAYCGVLAKHNLCATKATGKLISDATGLNVEEFNAALKRSTNEGLMMLLDQLHNAGGIDVLAPIFKDMGENGARASSVISALAANIDMVKWEQEEATKAFEEATSITK